MTQPELPELPELPDFEEIFEGGFTYGSTLPRIARIEDLLREFLTKLGQIEDFWTLEEQARPELKGLEQESFIPAELETTIEAPASTTVNVYCGLGRPE